MKSFKKCEGVVVPMVTPFDADGNIDLMAARKITRNLIDHGAIPFILGTTGEAPSVTLSQRAAFVEAVADEADGEVPVYAGIASNCSADSIKMAVDGWQNGADFLVAHLPSYYSLDAGQMEAYFLRLADSVPGPLVLYNILATTHMSIPFDLVVKLSEHPNIVGIKDSEQDFDRQARIIEYCKNREGFDHLIGWGARCKDALLLGSDGIVPSTGNFAPEVYSQLVHAAKNGDEALADEYQRMSNELSAVYQKGRTLSRFLAGLKVIMHHLGLCEPYVLPPLVQLPEAECEAIRREFSDLAAGYDLAGIAEKPGS